MSQNLQAVLTDVAGRIIAEHSFNSNELNISASGIPVGLYFLKVSGKEVRHIQSP